MQYPVENVIEEIKKALFEERKVVLQAPPGAGKTTIVPISLLHEPWLLGKKIIILEPRRIAARASAYRMAELLNERVGQTVGYHISMDRCLGHKTRIEVITEGILTRRIQNDPTLEGTGLIIFDEFHERNLHSDLGLALALECSEVFSEELRFLVMSATIDTSNISNLMGNVPVIISEGKKWPVETRYVPVKQKGTPFYDIEKQYVNTIKVVLDSEEGDILVFLPGVREIKRVESLLLKTIMTENVSIIPLFGRLSKKEQDRAIFPSSMGFRKIVLATSIAETSITIDGVSIVIDSGLMRAPRYYSGTGMSRLETVRVSHASAEQRRGRAGRTKPGVCYRLWDKSIEAVLKDYNAPEIMNTDLTGFMLELALWGVSDIHTLKLIDYPPESSIQKAQQILTDIGAINLAGKITPHGKKMATIGIHPRLAHMILKGSESGDAEIACFIAAVLSQRDFISFVDYRESDIVIRLEILKAFHENKNYYDKNIRINKSLVMQVLKNALKYKKTISAKNDTFNLNKAGELLAFAFPERILQLRSSQEGNYLMANGMGAFIIKDDYLFSEKYLVAAELDGNAHNSKVYLAAAYSKEQLIQSFNHTFQKVENVRWDKKSKSVICKRELKYRELVISKETIENAATDIVADEMLYGIKECGISCLPWDKELRNFQARAVLIHKISQFDDFPDISDDALTGSMDVWLKPFLHGVTKISQLNKLNLKNILFSLFDWKTKQKVESEAPTHITVASGSRIPLKYFTKENGVESSPVLAVRLQELFGMRDTPYIGNGKIPVTIHLLSPASKPVQVTKDLKSFWEKTYFEVKKELKGRYPKHYWPDDPLNAVPTNKTKKAR